MGRYLYLVRHGESVSNAAALHAGQLDYPLSDKGREQAAASRVQLEGIHFDTVFASDLSRAAETGRIMLPDADFIYRRDLREVDVGALAGRNRDDCLAAYGEAYLDAISLRDYAKFGGESIADFTARIKAFFDEVAAHEEYGEHMIAFCHGGFINGAARLVLGHPYSPLPLAVSNCSISAFFCNGKTWSVRTFNHLPDLPQ